MLPKTLTFTVYGNPVGYKRTTQAGCKFDKGYKRYQSYKQTVIDAFVAKHGGDRGVKPLTTVRGEKTRVDIKIYFRDYTHGDPDNVFKGCADSLFVNDKYVYGSFTFDYDKANPRVEITIS